MRVAWLPCSISKLLPIVCAVFAGRPPARPRGISRGRRLTVDHARPDADKLPTPAEQHRAWLQSSCLAARDLPGELRGAVRTVDFFDIAGDPLTYDLDGKPVRYVIRRFFTPDSGFTAGIEPKEKYLGPDDQPAHIYYPQIKKNFDWRKWARDPSQPKIFVEGAKKAACMGIFGRMAVGLQGCWGFSDKKRGHPILLDFDAYNFDACDVYWIPDRDRKEKAIDDVFRASESFAFLLKELGARVHVVELPFLDDGGKVGVDDFLRHFNDKVNKDAAKEALDKLLSEAGEWAGYDLTDPGNASRWVALYGHRFRYVSKRWLEYRNGRWQEDEMGVHELTVSQMFQDMVDDARRSGVTKWFETLKKHVTKVRVDFAVAMARRRPPVAASVNQFDQQPLWLNCKKHTLELPTFNTKGNDND